MNDCSCIANVVATTSAMPLFSPSLFLPCELLIIKYWTTTTTAPHPVAFFSLVLRLWQYRVGCSTSLWFVIVLFDIYFIHMQNYIQMFNKLFSIVKKELKRNNCEICVVSQCRTLMKNKMLECSFSNQLLLCIVQKSRNEITHLLRGHSTRMRKPCIQNMHY